MPGYPGTPRFGIPIDVHSGKPDAAGRNRLAIQNEEGSFVEQHQLLNPAQKSREVGSPPGKSYDEEPNQYEAPCNHDDYEGGDVHISNLDELKVLKNTIYAVKVKCADDCQNISGSDERS